MHSDESRAEGSSEHIPSHPGPVDLRNKRQFQPKTRTLTTERADWVQLAQELVYEAIHMPGMGTDHIAKDCMAISNMIVVALRRSAAFPRRPEDRISIRFKGAEYETLLTYSTAHPRAAEAVVATDN